MFSHFKAAFSGSSCSFNGGVCLGVEIFSNQLCQMELETHFRRNYTITLENQPDNWKQQPWMKTCISSIETWCFSICRCYNPWRVSLSQVFSLCPCTTGCKKQRGGRCEMWLLVMKNSHKRSLTPPKTNMEPKKWGFGRWSSFSNRWFSGSMLVFRGVTIVGGLKG